MGLLILFSLHSSCLLFTSLFAFTIPACSSPFLLTPHRSCLLLTSPARSSPFLFAPRRSCLLLTAPACSSTFLFAPLDAEYAVSGPPSHQFGKMSRWSKGWTIRKGFRPKAAPVVQRMDHREWFPPKSSTGGPKDGPSGMVSAQKQHRWSNGWTIRKGFRPKAAPVVQRMDHREWFPSKSGTGGPKDGPSGKGFDRVGPLEALFGPTLSTARQRIRKEGPSARGFGGRRPTQGVSGGTPPVPWGCRGIRKEGPAARQTPLSSRSRRLLEESCAVILDVSLLHHFGHDHLGGVADFLGLVVADVFGGDC